MDLKRIVHDMICLGGSRERRDRGVEFGGIWKAAAAEAVQTVGCRSERQLRLRLHASGSHPKRVPTCFAFSNFTSTSAFRNNNFAQHESGGMSGSVTPARRSRDESDDGEEEDFEVSVDGESPPRSNRSKRARLSDEEEVEEEEEDQNGEARLQIPPRFHSTRANMQHRHRSCQTASAARPKASVARSTASRTAMDDRRRINLAPSCASL